MGVLLFCLLFIFMAIGVPIAFSIELSSAFTLMATHFRPLILVAQRMVVGTDSFPLLAVPLFVLVGSLMEYGGISQRLINWADSIVGNLTGGLGMVMILACVVFAALTGSGPATVAAIGSILIPAMVKKGYDKASAAGLAAAAGALGPIIPPSIPMIIYGVTANVSIPQMFIAGIIPGLFIAFLLMLTNYFVCKNKGIAGSKEALSIKKIIKATWRAMGALLLPIVILGGIYGGIFTPTEAAAVGVVYSLIVGLIFELKFKDLGHILIETTEVSTMVIFIIANANLLGWIMSAIQLPQIIANIVVSLIHSKIVYILALNAFLFFVGAIMDTIAAIIILAPILVPIGLSFGMNPLHLGVMFVINLVIGYVTPPFGYNLFTACSITNLKLEEVVSGVIPFLIVEMVSVIVLFFIPQFVLWLPNILFG
ncbi:TRAP transporter large permease [Acetomicrobium sp. UBA5826]|uniref:TRAP transporter large permease n=1 Tax=Acetomicrobium sp. UBA5826 TaxID=1946039 RepID=UPI00257B349F|nr:TRAP transporter large permease [Acetomicrobium sp. UBA5826]